MTSHCFQKIYKTCKEVYQLCRVGPSQPHLVSSTMHPAFCDPGREAAFQSLAFSTELQSTSHALTSPRTRFLHASPAQCFIPRILFKCHLRDTVHGCTTRSHQPALCSKRTIQTYDPQGFSIFKFEFSTMQPVTSP